MRKERGVEVGKGHISMTYLMARSQGKSVQGRQFSKCENDKVRYSEIVKLSCNLPCESIKTCWETRLKASTIEERSARESAGGTSLSMKRIRITRTWRKPPK